MIRDYLSQGIKRFQQEIAQLTGSPDVVFHGTEDVVKMILFHMPNTCPSTFQIRVGADYPRTPPVVKCLDDSFENEYINRDKVLTHPDLKHRWITSYGVTNLIQTARTVSFMFDYSLPTHEHTQNAWFDPNRAPNIYSCQSSQCNDSAVCDTTPSTSSVGAIDPTTDFRYLSLSARQPRSDHLQTTATVPAARTPPSYQYPSHLRATYICDNVGVDEAKFFKAAGVLLYRSHPQKGLQVLLGQETKSRYMWSLLGGKKDDKESIWSTAAREFNEETGKVLDTYHSGSGGRGVISTIYSALEAICRSPQATEGIQMCWYGDGKYGLFLVNVDAIPGLRTATNDIAHHYNRFIHSAKSRMMGHECREMSEVKWLCVGDLMGSRATIKLSQFGEKLFNDSIFQEWLVACDDSVWAAASEPVSGRQGKGRGSRNAGIPASPVRGTSSQRPSSAPRASRHTSLGVSVHYDSYASSTASSGTSKHTHRSNTATAQHGGCVTTSATKAANYTSRPNYTARGPSASNGPSGASAVAVSGSAGSFHAATRSASTSREGRSAAGAGGRGGYVGVSTASWSGRDVRKKQQSVSLGSNKWRS